MLIFSFVLLLLLINIGSTVLAPIFGRKVDHSHAYMALIKWGALVTDGRGKIGGQVLSRGRSGAILRNKVTPVNPRSAAQVTARNILTSLSQGWSGLTQAQRDQWNNAVTNFQKTNIFGDLVSPTGKNLHTALNTNLTIIGQSTIDVPPEVAAVTPVLFDTLTMTTAVPAHEFTFTPDPTPNDQTTILYATAPQSAGRGFVKSQYRKVTTIAAAQASPFDFATVYTSRFGALPPEGTKVFLKMIPVLNASGIRGAEASISGIVAA